MKMDKVVFVDGGSSDGSVEWINKHLTNQLGCDVEFIQSPSGRAKQMNAGAQRAEQDVVLFLHADTELPNETHQEVAQAVSQNYLWGRFNVTFDQPSVVMNVIAFFINYRSRLSKVATGDQAMFIDRDLFNQLGGFDDIALMEDVALSKKLIKLNKPPYASKETVTTSARRWQQDGVVKTVCKMWWYRFAFFLGASPEFLAQGYRNVR